MPGAPSAIWLKVVEPSSRLRRMRGVQRYGEDLRGPGDRAVLAVRAHAVSVAEASVDRLVHFLVWTDRRRGRHHARHGATNDTETRNARSGSGMGWSRRERYLELSDPALRLRVVEVGSGRPVLFIPGTGGTGPYWAPLFRELSGVRCLALDRPGWGLSSPIDYRSGEFGSLAASTLVKVLDALELDRVDIVGASIGGLWALHLARRHPSRVGRVVVLGGMPTARSACRDSSSCSHHPSARSWCASRCRRRCSIAAARPSVMDPAWPPDGWTTSSPGGLRVQQRHAIDAPRAGHGSRASGGGWMATWVHPGGPRTCRGAATRTHDLRLGRPDRDP